MAENDDTNAAESAGGNKPKDTPAQKKQVKNEHVLIAIGIITVVVMFVYARRQANAANSSTTAQVPGTSPYGYATNPASQYGGGVDSGYMQQELSVIAQDLQSMQSEIVGLNPPTVNNGGGGGGSAGGSAGGPVSGTSLPPVNAAAYPQIVKYGQYAASDYTKIGQDVNGVYSGQQVSGGVPVYTNIFGGMAQGPMPTSGSYDVYIPSQFTAYEHA